MISGAHVIVYSSDAKADRAFFRDVLKFPWVDAGDDWLIFALPPAEVAVHPAKENSAQQLFLMCEDLAVTVRELRRRKVPCSKPVDRGWGTLVQITLPGGGELGLYQPKHSLAPR
jgi:hypothetical protein